jgi:hypothetical protein
MNSIDLLRKSMSELLDFAFDEEDIDESIIAAQQAQRHSLATKAGHRRMGRGAPGPKMSGSQETRVRGPKRTGAPPSMRNLKPGHIHFDEMDQPQFNQFTQYGQPVNPMLNGAPPVSWFDAPAVFPTHMQSLIPQQPQNPMAPIPVNPDTDRMARQSKMEDAALQKGTTLQGQMNQDSRELTTDQLACKYYDVLSQGLKGTASRED